MPIFVCLWAYIMCLVVGSFDRSWLGTGYGSNLYFIFCFYVVIFQPCILTLLIETFAFSSLCLVVYLVVF